MSGKKRPQQVRKRSCEHPGVGCDEIDGCACGCPDCEAVQDDADYAQDPMSQYSFEDGDYPEF